MFLEQLLLGFVEGLKAIGEHGIHGTVINQLWFQLLINISQHFIHFCGPW